MQAVFAVFQAVVGLDRAAECMSDAVHLAAILHGLGVQAVFEVGTMFYQATPDQTIFFHALTEGQIEKGKTPFHTWLRVNGRVLDMNIGAVLRKHVKPEDRQRHYRDYIYGFDTNTLNGFGEPLHLFMKSMHQLPEERQTLKQIIANSAAAYREIMAGKTLNGITEDGKSFILTRESYNEF